MDMPEQFRKLTRGFHQRLFEDVSSLDELVDHVLLSIEPEDVPQARAFLDEIMSGQIDGAKLLEIWGSSRAAFDFADANDLLKVLRLVRKRMDSHPYLNRAS